MNPINSQHIAKYGTNKLQKSGKGGRIQLPEPLLETLGIKYGQQIEIEANLSEKLIILKPKKTGAKRKDSVEIK